MCVFLFSSFIRLKHYSVYLTLPVWIFVFWFYIVITELMRTFFRLFSAPPPLPPLLSLFFLFLLCLLLLGIPFLCAVTNNFFLFQSSQMHIILTGTRCVCISQNVLHELMTKVLGDVLTNHFLYWSTSAWKENWWIHASDWSIKIWWVLKILWKGIVTFWILYNIKVTFKKWLGKDWCLRPCRKCLGM